jgi:hypothetical protein
LKAIALVVGDEVQNSEKLDTSRLIRERAALGQAEKYGRQGELTKAAKTIYLTMRAFPAAMMDVGVL